MPLQILVGCTITFLSTNLDYFDHFLNLIMHTGIETQIHSSPYTFVNNPATVMAPYGKEFFVSADLRRLVIRTALSFWWSQNQHHGQQ